MADDREALVRRSPIFRNSDDRLRGLEREAFASGDLASLMRLLFEARRTAVAVKQSWMDAIVAAAPGVDAWREVLATVPEQQHEVLLSSLRDARTWTFIIAAFRGTSEAGRLPAWIEAPITATLEVLRGPHSATVGRALRMARDELHGAARGPLAEFALESQRRRDTSLSQSGFFEVRESAPFEPDEPDEELEPLQDIQYGSLRRVDVPASGAIRADRYWMPEFLSSGHYVKGDSTSRANRDTFLMTWGATPGVRRVVGGYGFSGVLIRLDTQCPQQMLEDLATAREGYDLDEDRRHELEESERSEAWDTWIKDDMLRVLPATFPSLKDQIADGLTERELYDLFYEATERHERSESPWGYGPQGAEINLDSLIEDELTVEDVEAAIEKARGREAGEGEQESGD